MFKHILIPTDGSDPSKRAIVAGVEMAKKLHAKVTGLFVAPPATPMIYGKFMPIRYMPPDGHAELIERTAREYLGQIEETCAAAKVPVESVTVTSDFPADEILKAAKARGVDAIFMASHGHRGVSAVLLALDNLKEFDMIYTITQGGPGIASETLYLYSYMVGFGFFTAGYGSALMVVVFLIVLVFNVVMNRMRLSAQDR